MTDHGDAEPGDRTAARPRPTSRRSARTSSRSTRRLRQPRTIISLVLPIVLLVLFVRSLPGFKLEELPDKILGANPLLLLAAFVIFYPGFPLRGLRWAILVRKTGFALKVRDAIEIIFLSWLVNCLVPAKLGDVYRAYLLKINSTVSLSRTFGTVFIERILDLFAIVTLGLAAGFVSFRSGLPGDVQIVFAIGIGFVLLLAGGLLTHAQLRAADPHRGCRCRTASSSSTTGSRRACSPRSACGRCRASWSSPASSGRPRRCACTSSSRRSGCRTSTSASAAPSSSPCAASLLTAVPLTPAGIGFVESGVVGLLTIVYGVSETDALAITLVDRAISVLSIIIHRLDRLRAFVEAARPRRPGVTHARVGPPPASCRRNRRIIRGQAARVSPDGTSVVHSRRAPATPHVGAPHTTPRNPLVPVLQ